jgi:peroxiredoxin
MKLLSTAALALAVLALGCAPAKALDVGKPAPDFTGVDADNQKQALSAQKGKWVVLEWLNHGCPYVQKHYEAKNMQALQEKWTKKGVVWMSIISSAKGKQGYSEPPKAKADQAKHGSKATRIILDPKGTIGKLYGAKTTPHMFIIDPEGNLVYEGAIDSVRSADPADIAKSENYVDLALTAAMAGKPIKQAKTKPYGCSVKYE